MGSFIYAVMCNGCDICYILRLISQCQVKPISSLERSQVDMFLLSDNQLIICIAIKEVICDQRVTWMLIQLETWISENQLSAMRSCSLVMLFCGVARSNPIAV